MRSRALGSFLVLFVLFFAAGDADARTRRFCAGPFGIGGVDRNCGRHLQPFCDSGAACDPGFISWNGVGFPIPINCPSR